MHSLVVGTSGHIDHGKTSLVKALTGIDTDRLAEEKARGITIELGFAHKRLEGGVNLAFVDVPGHERFVRAMIAGAAGIDVVLWIVAADEGVMPQSREHLDILRLLTVKRGIIVLTKIDLVDPELLELAQADVLDTAAGTFLENAPVIPVSAVTGQGLDLLLQALERMAGIQEPRSVAGAFRLPIDRVFTLKGFGTVVTGTVFSGVASAGDTLEALPGGRLVKVRGLQVHGAEVRSASAGQRVAINLQGVDRDELERGQQLCAPGTLPLTQILDVAYEHLSTSGVPLAHRARVRFHQGTTEVGGVAHVLGEDLLPGQSGFLQLRLDAPVAVHAGDRFVLRRESPMSTLGGGVVVDPLPAKHRGRSRREAVELLERFELATESAAPHVDPREGARAEPPAGDGATVQAAGDEGIDASPASTSPASTSPASTSPDPDPASSPGSSVPGGNLEVWLELAGAAGIPVDELARRSGWPRQQVVLALERAVAHGRACALDPEGREYVGKKVFEALGLEMLEFLRGFHAKHPMKPGASRGELRAGVSWSGERVFLRCLEELLSRHAVGLEGTLYRLAGFSPRLAGPAALIADAVRQQMALSGLATPFLSELRESIGADSVLLEEVLRFLVDSGELVKIREGYYVPVGAIRALQEQMTVFLRTQKELRPVQFKELTGLSRKWAIPLLEYFDKIQFTLRVGEARV